MPSVTKVFAAHHGAAQSFLIINFEYRVHHRAAILLLGGRGDEAVFTLAAVAASQQARHIHGAERVDERA